MTIKKMRNLTRLMTVLVTLVLAVSFPGLASAQTATVVSVSAPEQVEAEEQFVVNIVVEPGTEIAGVQFDLVYDPSLVTVNSVEEGNLLSQGGAATYFSGGSIDNVSGRIDGVAGAIITPGQTVSAAGTFAVITMTAATEDGTCQFTLTEVVAGDIDGQSVEVNTVNGQVIIGEDTAPPSGGGGGGGGGGGSIDETPPSFSDISTINVTMTTVEIRWVTEEESTSQVEYWASQSQFTPLDETLVTDHVVQLTELMPATIYHYRVMSEDVEGNLAVSGECVFTTLGAPAAFVVSSLTIAPEEIFVGDELYIVASVTNSGDTAGDYKVILRINESVVETKNVSLDGHTVLDVAFYTTITAPGIYSIDVNGRTADIDVIDVVERAETITGISPTPTINAFAVSPDYQDGKLTGVNVYCEVYNPAGQAVRGDVILVVALDGQPVAEVGIMLYNLLEPGVTVTGLHYSPVGGWKAGTYSFSVELYSDGEFVHSDSGQTLDVIPEQVTTTVSWSFLALIIAIALVVSALIAALIIRFKKKMI